MSGRSGISAMILLVAALLAVAQGCGKEGGGGSIPRVSVERAGEGREGGAVKLEGGDEDSRVEVWEFEPDGESLGVPVYPGAELAPGTALASRTTLGERELLIHQAEYVTSNDYQAVVRWYRKEMGEPLDSGEGEATWVTVEDEGILKTVMVKRMEGGAQIRFMRLEGDLWLRLEE
ncbi:MAG: hypothetical protein ACUVT4_10190 [Actinomycetota bacterium]